MDLKLFAAPVLAYLLGSIPFSYIVARIKSGSDIRSQGSGNVGATNVMRTTGKTAGAIALLLDVGKGAAAVALTRAWTGSVSCSALSGFACAVGHSYPVFLQFRGGKSVATGAGAFIVLSVPAIASSLGVFAIALLAFRIVSLASILGSASFPLFAWIFGAARGIILWGAATALLIVLRHHSNIRRLLKGTERRMGAVKHD